jgi:hypothetical protein
MDACTGSRFIIVSLPRCGSTTLARLLNTHQGIRCLVEPFHPRRYEGRFHALTRKHSLDNILAFIWSRWNGIKHVWEASGWPFAEQPELNDQLVLGKDRRILFLMRRNLLRRFISNYICRQTRFWIGTRAEFSASLANTELRPLDAASVLREIRRDQEAVAQRLQSMSDHKVHFLPLFYEDIFRPAATDSDRMALMNSVLTFLDFPPITSETFLTDWLQHFDPMLNRWASAEVYRRIPEIDRLEEAVGSDETGWLFR